MSVIKVNNITNRDGTLGPVIAGIATVSSTSHLVVPTGNTGQKVALAPDPFIDNLVLALPFNSESVFDDISPKGQGTSGVGIGTTTASLPFGVSGVTTTSSGIVTFSKYYGSSLFFDGNDWVNVTTPGNGDFIFNTGDFTIEFWAYTTTVSGSARVINQDLNNSGSGAGTFLVIKDNASMGFYSAVSSTWDNVNNLSMGTISVNTWTHFAVTRLNGIVYSWKDGVQQSSVSGDKNLSDGGLVRIGTYGAGVGQFWNGYLQDLRIYKGVAKYTSNFTPPNQIAL
jgi:hypothetical protein